MVAAKHFSNAIVRAPCRGFGSGLTTADLGPPDFSVMQTQHQAYIEALQNAGLQVEVLPALDGLADAHFVEDVAVVTPELAVVTRPGAQARRGETAFIEAALGRHRPLAHIQAQGTLEGGDVLQIGRRFLVGLSARTNAQGVDQLRGLLSPHGYQVIAVPVAEGLHFKSDVNWLGDEQLVVTPAFAGCEQLASFDKLVLPPEEAYAANCVRVNDHLLISDGYPKAHAMLSELGLTLIPLGTSECAKMDGGLTCLSLRF